MIIGIKNISGVAKELHIHAFGVDEELVIDSSWYVDSVIEAVSQKEFAIFNSVGVIEGVKEQLQWLQSNPDISVVRMPAPSPFSEPSFCVKRDAISSIATVSKNSSLNIDFKMLHTRFTHGGVLFGENIMLGDYVSACIIDLDGIIPEFMRGQFVDYPIVTTYVVKEFIKPVGCHEINTYPMGGEVGQGLYLRITYNATDSGEDRKIAINYYLAEKLW